LISKTGATPNNYLFAGEQFDPALGIYYNRARYYDQRQGRFWTMDTIEGEDSSPASLHKYTYAAANPVSYNDPSGYAYVSNWLFGGIVHRYLGNLYSQQTGGCSDTQLIRLITGICDNRIVGLGGIDGGYRPDLANPFPDKGDIFEIKPINSAANALPQLLGYLAYLRLADNRANAPKWHLGKGSEFSYPSVLQLNAVTVAYIAPPVLGAIIYYVAGVDDVLAAGALGVAAITGALGAGNVAAATAAEASNVLSIGSAVRLANAAEAAASAEIEADVGEAIVLDLAA
jgi:RHS repeat-associated protein